MKNVIEEYINSIECRKSFSMTTLQDEDEWRFFGDGLGDFEELASEARGECILHYIDFCQEQIRLAEKYYLRRIAVK